MCLICLLAVRLLIRNNSRWLLQINCGYGAWNMMCVFRSETFIYTCNRGMGFLVDFSSFQHWRWSSVHFQMQKQHEPEFRPPMTAPCISSLITLAFSLQSFKWLFSDGCFVLLLFPVHWLGTRKWKTNNLSSWSMWGAHEVKLINPSLNIPCFLLWALAMDKIKFNLNK